MTFITFDSFYKNVATVINTENKAFNILYTVHLHTHAHTLHTFVAIFDWAHSS